MSKKIIIVDDHSLFGQSLKGLVNSFQKFKVLEVLKNGQELVEYLSANKIKPDIILLDIRMPVMDGIETMAWINQNLPEQKVLALTMEHDEETIIKMIKSGCRGYLLKDIDPDEFLFSLECVIESGYYINEESSVALSCTPKDTILGQVSHRELEFLNLACSELTYKEVAGEMNLSPKTIDGYRESLFQKLQVKSRVGLVLFAVKNKLVEI
ncbi:response regulator transcription factor [soil metagenome]